MLKENDLYVNKQNVTIRVNDMRTKIKPNLYFVVACAYYKYCCNKLFMICL